MIDPEQLFEDSKAEQIRLLEQMLRLGWVTRYAWDYMTGQWAICFTDLRFQKMGLLREMTAELGYKGLATWVGLDALAQGHFWPT